MLKDNLFPIRPLPTKITLHYFRYYGNDIALFISYTRHREQLRFDWLHSIELVTQCSPRETLLRDDIRLGKGRMGSTLVPIYPLWGKH